MDALKKKAIILKKVAYQESDLILKVLTSTGEKLDVMAKGAQKSKKRFGGGVLDPLNYIELTFAPQKNKTSTWFYLNEAQIIYDFSQIRTDYDRIKMALYFLKVVTKVELESDSSYVFDLLLHALRATESSPNLNILKCQFEIKFLFKQGVLLPDEHLMPFLKASLYDSSKLPSGPMLESTIRRSSFEMENYFEQLMDIS